MIVLDSSAVIEFFSGDKRGKKVKAIINKESIAVTSITVHEVLHGVKGREKEAIIEFFKSIIILPFDADASLKSIVLEEALMAKGKPLAKLDLFIAAICIQRQCKLITTDKDFKKVDALEIIPI